MTCPRCCLAAPALVRQRPSRTHAHKRIHTPRAHADAGAADRHRAGPRAQPALGTHARKHARTHARTHACTHARMHARTHARCEFAPASAARCTACGCHRRTRVSPTRARRMASTPLTGDVHTAPLVPSRAPASLGAMVRSRLRCALLGRFSSGCRAAVQSMLPVGHFTAVERPTAPIVGRIPAAAARSNSV
jgi:hypothetical protein